LDLSSYLFRYRGAFSVAAGLCIGLAVPLSQIGVAYTTILSAVGVAIAVLHPERRIWIAGMARCLRSPVGIALAVLFLAWVPNLFVSPDPAKSLQVWVRTIAYLSLGAMLWAYLREDRDALALTGKIIIIGAAFTVVLVAVNFLGGTEYIRALRLKEFTEGYPPKVMKHYASPAACMIPVLLYIGWRLGRNWFVLAVAACIGFGAFAYLTGSGAAAAGFLVGLYCAGLAWCAKGGWKLPLAGAAVLAVGVVAGFLWLGAQEVPTRGNFEDYSVSHYLLDRHRQLIWMFVLEKVPDALWFGHGIDAINKTPGADTQIPFLKAEVLPSHPHSWALEIVAETGVLGASAMIFVLGLVFIRACRSYPSAPGAAVTLTALLGIYFGSGLFSFSFWASWWQLVLIILWAIVSAEGDRSVLQSDERDHERRAR
jgi:O-antigen ligase